MLMHSFALTVGHAEAESSSANHADHKLEANVTAAMRTSLLGRQDRGRHTEGSFGHSGYQLAPDPGSNLLVLHLTILKHI